MIASLDQSHQRAVHSSHPRRSGKARLSAFQSRHPVLKHRERRVAVAGVDELIPFDFDEPLFRVFGCVVNKPLGQENRL